MSAIIAPPGSLTAWPFFGGISPLAFATPNPRRTIILKTATWVDTFEPMDTDETDVLSIDFSRLLSPGECILTLESFCLTTVGQLGPGDATAASRVMGIATVEGNIVSQRFGNWQDLPWVKYLVTAEIVTNIGNPIEASAYLSVRSDAA